MSWFKKWVSSIPVKLLLQWFFSSWSGISNTDEELLCLHFSCLSVSSLPCVLWLYTCLTQQWSDLPCCAAPHHHHHTHTEGSMVGDNDTNPLAGPGSLITPTLLGSFHTILTFVNSSCQNSCQFLIIYFPILVENLGMHEYVFGLTHKSPEHLGKWETNLLLAGLYNALLTWFYFCPYGLSVCCCTMLPSRLCSVAMSSPSTSLDLFLSQFYLHEIRVYTTKVQDEWKSNRHCWLHMLRLEWVKLCWLKVPHLLTPRCCSNTVLL